MRKLLTILRSEGMRKLLTILGIALACAFFLWLGREYLVGETLTIALPGLWTALIAIVSGAGGAMLLELWFRPRIQRRKAAVVLAAEMTNNAHSIAAHFVVRRKSPFKIRDDFRMALAGFHAVADRIPELEANLVGRILLLYSRFATINQLVDRYSETMSRFEEMVGDDPRGAQTEKYLLAVVDAFNDGVDKAFQDVKELHPVLLKIGRIKIQQPDPEKPPEEFVKRIEMDMTERQRRLAILERLRQRSEAEKQAAEAHDE